MALFLACFLSFTFSLTSGWFMRAFVSSSTNQHVTAVELYRRAVEILQWGQRKWKDVPSDDKGSIFEPTYIRGVKRFYMTALMEVLEPKVSHAASLYGIQLSGLRRPW